MVDEDTSIARNQKKKTSSAKSRNLPVVFRVREAILQVAIRKEALEMYGQASVYMSEVRDMARMYVHMVDRL
jgi:hypothetical protein